MRLNLALGTNCRVAFVLLTAIPLATFLKPASGQTREEAVLWKSIEGSKNPSDFRGYLDRYPEGTLAPVAKRRIADLIVELNTKRTRSFVLETLAEVQSGGRPTVPGMLGKLTISPEGVT